jgi:hypothetical protein
MRLQLAAQATAATGRRSLAARVCRVSDITIHFLNHPGSAWKAIDQSSSALVTSITWHRFLMAGFAFNQSRPGDWQHNHGCCLATSRGNVGKGDDSVRTNSFRFSRYLF